MNKITHSLPAKIAALILLTISAITAVFSPVGIYLMAENNFYTQSEAAVQQNTMQTLIASDLYSVGNYYKNYGKWNTEQYFANMNFLFTVTDAAGMVLADNRNGQPVLWETEVQFSLPGASSIITITGGPGEGQPLSDRYAVANFLVSNGYRLRHWIIGFAVISLLSTILLLIFLCCAAGRKRGCEQPELNRFDRFVPFDVMTAGFILIIVLLFSMLQAFASAGAWLALIAAGICIITGFLIIIWYLMSFAARVKTGKLIKGTLTYFLLSALFRGLGKLLRGLAYLFRNLSLTWKTALSLIAYFSLDLFMMLLSENSGSFFFWWFLKTVTLIPLILLIAVSLRKLQKGGETIAAGDLNYKVDTQYLYGDFKRFGDRLNSIRAGMSHAVEERMRSERFKTELITNVSHDIKTPLTSIINYVDLIKKEEPENEAIKNYLEVLDRQSARLKKLIEDLVEASKASTGNLKTTLEPCEVGVLLSQAVGEYNDKLRARNLEPVLTLPSVPVRILADGQHLWRVLDNLMNNICKYALPSSRVYLSLEELAGQAIITFRNISSAPLNISGEELMERFVRGDASRHTEGSGLGLSIARSLTELQQGTLTLTVDGDLFKVILTFHTISEKEISHGINSNH